MWCGTRLDAGREAPQGEDYDQGTDAVRTRGGTHGRWDGCRVREDRLSADSGPVCCRRRRVRRGGISQARGSGQRGWDGGSNVAPGRESQGGFGQDQPVTQGPPMQAGTPPLLGRDRVPGEHRASRGQGVAQQGQRKRLQPRRSRHTPHPNRIHGGVLLHSRAPRNGYRRRQPERERPRAHVPHGYGM